jgi:phage gpG-like protein
MSDFFRLKFTIEGVPEVSRILLMTNQKVTNFKKPLWNSAKMVLQDVERNFQTEGSLVGGWSPLAESTVKGRIREGYGGAHPILQKTGSLKRSFFSAVDAKKAVISSKSPYFVYHQSREPRQRLPRRAMLVMTEYTKENIVEEFNKFLRYK